MGIEKEQPFVVRDYLPKGSLRNRLSLLSPQLLELEEALTLVLQIGRALVTAHEHDIFHGSIKPENILLDLHDQVILTDFSLVSDLDIIIRDRVAEEYAFCYMAPELYVGTCDAQSDQYALGCLAYELITGHVPFDAQDINFAPMKAYHSNAHHAPLFEDATDLPPSLKTAVIKTLAEDPAERFFDFSLFLEVIQAAVSPSPVFPFAHSARIHENRTSSHSEHLNNSETRSSESAMVTSLTKEKADEELISDPFEEEQEEISLTGVLVSSSHEWIISTIGSIALSLAKNIDGFGSGIVRRSSGKIRPLVLALLLSMIITLVAHPFWPLEMSASDASLHTTPFSKNKLARLAITPTTTPTPVPTATPTPVPTATPLPTPIVVPSPNPPPATAIASSNPYPPYSGQLTLNDPLSDDSRGYGWDQSSSCQFTGGAYYVTSRSNNYYQVCYTALQVSNFAFEAQMQIIKGDCGGLEFRDTTNKEYGYFFEVCHDGTYGVYRFSSGRNSGGKTLVSGTSAAMVTGLNQSNLIAVVANGSNFDFYINNKKVDSASDSTFSQGLFGVCADIGAEAVYTNAKVWTL
jgi:serine/threonine protein kinase